MAARPQTCLDCSGPISLRNQSGRCRMCAPKALFDNPENRRRHREGVRRKIAADPTYRGALQQRARIIGKLPSAIEGRRRHCIESRMWEKGNAAQPAGSASRALAGKRSAETKLAWCPPHLIETYRGIVPSVGTSEAKRMILDLNNAEIARFRRKVIGDPSPDLDGNRLSPRPQPQAYGSTPASASHHALIEAVSSSFGFTVQDITGPVRKRPLAICRQMIAVLLLEAGLSTSSVGRLLNRDHTTIVHARKVFPAATDRQRELARAYEHYRKKWGIDQ